MLDCHGKWGRCSGGGWEDDRSSKIHSTEKSSPVKVVTRISRVGHGSNRHEAQLGTIRVGPNPTRARYWHDTTWEARSWVMGCAWTTFLKFDTSKTGQPSSWHAHLKQKSTKYKFYKWHTTPINLAQNVGLVVHGPYFLTRYEPDTTRIDLNPF